MTARTLSAVVLVLTALAAASLPTLPAQAAEGNVAVHVEDAGGDAIQGALVTARSDVADVAPQTGTTDEDGDASLLLAPGNWTIEVKADGFEPRKRAVAVAATGATVAFTLDAVDSGELDVLVIDSNGQPVDGADVVVRTPDGDEAASGETDDDGEVEFDLAHGLYYITAGKRGWSKGEAKIEFTPQDDRVKIQLAREAGDATVRVTVLDVGGDPVEGATVTANSWSDAGQSRTATGTTDGDGEVDLAVLAGYGNVQVRHNRYNSGWADFDARGGSADVTVTVERRPPTDARLEGTVTDEDGDPVPGATVYVRRNYYCCYAYASADAAESKAVAAEPAVAEDRMAMPYYCCDDLQTTTDEDGTYEIDVYSGDLLVEVHARGYAVETVRVVVKPDETEQADATLHEVPAKDATLRGRVFDARTGAPLANVGINLQNMEWSDWQWATTGADGRFELTTYSGYVQVWAYPNQGPICYAEAVPVDDAAPPPDGTTTEATTTDEVAPEEGSAEGMESGGGASGSAGYASEPSPGVATDIAIMPPCGVYPVQPVVQYYSFVVQLDLDSGDNELDVRLQPKPEPSVALVGYVVDSAAQQGIPNAWVNVRNEDTGEWGSAQTDEDGSFKILVRPGHFVLDANADGYFSRSETFEVGDETLVRHDVELRKGTARWVPYEPDPYSPDYAVREKGYAYDESGATTTASGGVAADASYGPRPPGPLASPALAEGGARTALADGDAASGASTYKGEGGGLGPYKPGAATTKD
ncbi:MAG TPA: carboxypeptidase regulatory-like domain-containing protein, partial [Candidatus Thermoplasmatota archaeon]|nr:carboxypeptidase regulatory-like domain-containing protein [Candidatus Thermoplasmatota archaeon]